MSRKLMPNNQLNQQHTDLIHPCYSTQIGKQNEGVLTEESPWPRICPGVHDLNHGGRENTVQEPPLGLTQEMKKFSYHRKERDKDEFEEEQLLLDQLYKQKEKEHELLMQLFQLKNRSRQRENSLGRHEKHQLDNEADAKDKEEQPQCEGNSGGKNKWQQRSLVHYKQQPQQHCQQHVQEKPLLEDTQRDRKRQKKRQQQEHVLCEQTLRELSPKPRLDNSPVRYSVLSLQRGRDLSLALPVKQAHPEYINTRQTQTKRLLSRSQRAENKEKIKRQMHHSPMAGTVRSPPKHEKEQLTGTRIKEHDYAQSTLVQKRLNDRHYSCEQQQQWQQYQSQQGQTSQFYTEYKQKQHQEQQSEAITHKNHREELEQVTPLHKYFSNSVNVAYEQLPRSNEGSFQNREICQPEFKSHIELKQVDSNAQEEQPDYKKTKPKRDNLRKLVQAKIQGRQHKLTEDEISPLRNPNNRQRKVFRQKQGRQSKQESNSLKIEQEGTSPQFCLIKCHTQHKHAARERRRYHSVDRHLIRLLRRQHLPQPRRFASDFLSFKSRHEYEKMFPFQFDALDVIAQKMQQCFEQYSSCQFQCQPLRQRQRQKAYKREKHHQQLVQLEKHRPEKISSFPICSRDRVPSNNFRSQPDCFQKCSAPSSEGRFYLPRSVFSDTVSLKHSGYLDLPNLPHGCTWYPSPPTFHTAASMRSTYSSQTRHALTSGRSSQAIKCLSPKSPQSKCSLNTSKQVWTKGSPQQSPKSQTFKTVPFKFKSKSSKSRNVTSPCVQYKKKRLRSTEYKNFDTRNLPPGSGLWLAEESLSRGLVESQYVRHKSNKNKSFTSPSSSFRGQIQQPHGSKLVAQNRSSSRDRDSKQRSPAMGAQCKANKPCPRTQNLVSRSNSKRGLKGPRSLSAGLVDSHIKITSSRQGPSDSLHRRGRKPWCGGYSVALKATPRSPNLLSTLSLDKKEQNSIPSLEKKTSTKKRSKKLNKSPRGGVDSYQFSVPDSDNSKLSHFSCPLDNFGNGPVAPNDHPLSQSSDKLQDLVDSMHGKRTDCSWAMASHSQLKNRPVTKQLVKCTGIYHPFGCPCLSKKSKDRLFGVYSCPYLLEWSKRGEPNAFESISSPVVNLDRAAILKRFGAEIDLCKGTLETPAMISHFEVDKRLLDTCKFYLSPACRGLLNTPYKTSESLSVIPRGNHSLPSLGSETGLWLKPPPSGAQEKSIEPRRNVHCASSETSAPPQSLRKQPVSLCVTTASAESWIKKREAASPRSCRSSSAVLSCPLKLPASLPYAGSSKTNSEQERMKAGVVSESGLDDEAMLESHRLVHRGSVLTGEVLAADDGVEDLASHSSVHHHHRGRSRESSRRRRRSRHVDSSKRGQVSVQSVFWSWALPAVCCLALFMFSIYFLACLQ